MEYEWDLAAAESEFKRAIDLDPNSAVAHEWYAILLGVSGRNAEMEQQIAIARQLDPLSLHVGLIEASKQYMQRKYSDAAGELRVLTEMDPNFQPAYSLLAAIYETLNQPAQAVAATEKGLELSGVPEQDIAALDRQYHEGGINAFLRAQNDLLRRMSRTGYVSPVLIAMNDARLGDVNSAFAELERAYCERSGWLLELNLDPVWDPLRRDPRFASLVRRVHEGTSAPARKMQRRSARFSQECCGPFHPALFGLLARRLSNQLAR
jgi:tetratricopeptide (TPR) repeat protein